MAPESVEKSVVVDRVLPFRRPAINLYPEPTENSEYIDSLPQLIEFNAKYNPNHVFCIQMQRQKALGVESTASALVPIRITNFDLRNAVLACQKWLLENVAEMQLPTAGKEDGAVTKGEPIALLMDSDVGLWIHKMALIGLGVPALLLSARLSATAVHHLVKTSHSAAILASRRLQSAALETSDLIHQEGGRLPVYTPEPYNSFLTVNNDSPQSLCHPHHYLSETDRSVLILHSSGTTGLPKPIYVSHRHLISFITCHGFENETEAQGINLSTLPLYHGFGLVAPGLAMGVGKTVCFPSTASVPNALSVVEMLRLIKAASLMTVPSILDDLSSMKYSEGLEVLSRLDFVTFGGGLLKPTVGDQLSAAGVKILNHYGATESGPLTPIFVPKSDYNWRYFRLRQDIKMTITELPPDPSLDGQRLFKLTTYPFGWSEPFEVQDRLICNPDHPSTDFNAVGRKDDWIVLATGEKVLPQILESMLSKHDLVKMALVFGEHRFEIGILVQPNQLLANEEEITAFKETIWPIVLEAGKHMDEHARVTSMDSIVVIPADSIIPRTDKGSIARKETYRAYIKEIDQVYQRLDSVTNGSSSFNALDDDTNLEETLKKAIQEEFTWAIPFEEWTYDDDLFEMGFNSLQAIRLRRYLVSWVHLKADGDLATAQELIGRDFIYANPTIRKIAHAIRRLQQGENSCSSASIASEVDYMVTKYSLSSKSTQRATILLTGATGSLGTHCLAQLAVLENVARVVCLNRPSKAQSEEPIHRQRRALSARGLVLCERIWSEKIEVHEVNLSSENLGLAAETYSTLELSITHILHTAWPMDFKWKLASFQGQFCTLQNLLRLACNIKKSNPNMKISKPRLIFISSIATVGQFSTVYKQRIIPEEPFQDVACVNNIGYAQAKYVCERLIQEAIIEYGNHVEASYIRLGQIAGARKDGQWNTHEHFPALLKSSQTLGALPQLPGTLSWMPVEDITNAIIEILLSPNPSRLVYHIENPVRQPWHEILQTFGHDLHIARTLPFDEWLAKVSSTDAASDANPAKKLLEFFQEDFLRMACGQVIMATDETRKTAKVMRTVDALKDMDLRRYLSYWKKIGFLS